MLRIASSSTGLLLRYASRSSARRENQICLRVSDTDIELKLFNTAAVLDGEHSGLLARNADCSAIFACAIDKERHVASSDEACFRPPSAHPISLETGRWCGRYAIAMRTSATFRPFHKSRKHAVLKTDSACLEHQGCSVMTFDRLPNGCSTAGP